MPRSRPLVLVGPTASGKSALAVEVARRTGGEILAVDSMAVYRGMDIGTATPSASERAGIAHHLIDLVDPGDPFTLVDYQVAFDAAMADLGRRSVTPVIAGGTGLYLRAAVDRLTPPPRYPEVEADLDAEADTGALHRRLVELDPVAAGRMEPTNRRRVLRALSVTIGGGTPFSEYGPGLDVYPEVPYRMVGIEIERHDMDERIDERYRRQMADGFLDEVRALAARPLSHTAAQALGYKELLAHLRGETTLDDALDLARSRTRRFARRQQRWFRRDPRIEWLRFGPIDTMADRLVS